MAATVHTLPIDPDRRTVECPVQGKLPSAECRDCPHCWMVHLGDSPGSAFVVCDPPVAAVRPHSAAPLSEARVVPVTTVMTRDVISVRPSLPIDRLIVLLIDRGIGAAPVVDVTGRVVGVVSRDDLVFDDYGWAELCEGHEAPVLRALLQSRTVAELMKPQVVTVPETASIAEAAAALDHHRAHEAIVVDGVGGLRGVVSQSDLVRWLATAAAD